MPTLDTAVYGALLQEFNVARVRQVNRERSARIAALQSKADAEAYVAGVRSKIASIFDLPERPADLNAQVTGVIETSDCKIEKIIFDSRKDFPVTAHLFVPRNLTAPAPAVLFLCGHSHNGKLWTAYHTGAYTLAKKGFVTLLVDPVSQGERYQFTKAPRAFRVNGLCTWEHNMMGKQLWLTGDFFGSWRVNDALCGLDYLLSRPEVDRSKVGVTGTSGGGTLSTFVHALDPRLTMAAPSCYVTSWQRNIENELPADAEQIPPGILAAGCEMGDFILAYAPRPVLLLGQKNDFFDPRGLQETFEECRKVYALLGAENNLQCFIGPDSHGYSALHRQEMYRFFGGLSGIDPAGDEAAYPNPEAGELLCTPTGQVADLPDKKSVHDLLTDKLDDLAAQRQKMDLSQLKELLSTHYGFNTGVPVPYCRSLRPEYLRTCEPKCIYGSRFALETTPGLITPVILRTTETKEFFHFPEMESLTLYIPHLSAAEEISDFAFDGPVLGVDMQGIGAALSRNCDLQDPEELFFNPYGCDYHFNSCEIMFGSSMLNRRVGEILGAIAYAGSRGVKKFKIHGHGLGAIPAVMAAILCDDITAVKLTDAPESFDSMVREYVTMWPQAVMLRGILKYTDLPDIYEALKAEKSLVISNFVNNFFEK